MEINTILIAALFSPILFTIGAIISAFQQGIRPKQLITWTKLSTVFGIISAIIVSSAVYQFGFLESALIGYKGLGFSIRLDSVSVIMYSMIALLAFIIMKYSVNYMDGDQRQGAFIGRLSATISAVQILVLSGNLGILLVSWILTSMALNRLLLFYPERVGAYFAAKKKFILARLGDFCLLLSASILFNEFGTGNLEIIFNALKEGNYDANNQLEWSGIFLALAAILKSAQFPTHGWLIEVMETPTPVSSLLHAGLLNAGPFLIIRMAYLIESTVAASILLIIIGGITAILASISYLTQSSVKTALGYSSIGHMGFSLMVSGLGIFPAAMLHLVAHSFYKAHAFLSSGSVIDRLKMLRPYPNQRRDNLFSLLLSFLIAGSIFVLSARTWGLNLNNNLGILMIGLIIVLGTARLMAVVIGQNMHWKLVIYSSFTTLLISNLFFGLEAGMGLLMGNSIPSISDLDLYKLIPVSFLMVLFSLCIILQIMASKLSQNDFILKMSIYFRNGFYMNAWFDKIVGSYRNFESIEKESIITSIPQKAIEKLKEQFA